MKATYRKMIEKIHPSEDLPDKVFEKIARKRIARFRPVAVAAAVLAVVMLGTPVMAAYVPPVAELMYQVSPEMAARFTPIQESCEKNGIRMEIVSASIHGATAEICISFEDLEGDRLNGQSMAEMFQTQFLGKSMFFSGSWGGTIKDTDFDEETGKLIMVMERTFSFYSEKEGRYLTVEELFGDKITVRVERLNEYVPQDAAEIPVTLTDSQVMTVEVDNSKPTDRPVEVPFDGFGSGSGITGDPWLTQDTYDLLTPGEPCYEVTEEVSIMGMAYIDGRLHVQTRLRGESEALPIYRIWFEDVQGNVVSYQNHNTFTINQGTDRGEYMEAIFDIPEEELSDFMLMCEVSEKQTIEGPWKITFPFTESDYVGEFDDGIPETTALD